MLLFYDFYVFVHLLVCIDFHRVYLTVFACCLMRNDDDDEDRLE